VKKIIALAVASLLSITAMAEGPAKTDTGINYNNVEASYESYKINSYTWNGYGLGGNFLLNESIYATANYSQMSPETSGVRLQMV
jgi:hypothetical protein